MHYRINLIFILGALSLHCFATEVSMPVEGELQRMDSLSYAQFQNHAWKDLMHTGIEAKAKGISFFYLDFRIGIAYFNTHMYRKALSYFERCYFLDFNNEDLNAYLYYCYLYCEEFDRAFALKPTHRLSLLEFTGGDKLSSNTAKFGDLHFTSLASNTQVRKNNALYVNASYLNQSQFYGNLQGKSTTYALMTQGQVFAGYQIPFSHWWKLELAGHGLYYDLKSSVNGFSSSAQLAGLGSIQLSHAESTYNVYLTQTVGNLNLKTQIEHGLGIIGYPIKNNSFKIEAKAFSHSQDLERTTHLIFTGSIAWRPSKYVDFRLLYAYVNCTNTIEENGLLVNNAADLLKTKSNFSGTIYCGKKIGITLLFQYEERLGNYYFYDYNSLYRQSKSTTYFMSTGMLGLKWFL